MTLRVTNRTEYPTREVARLARKTLGYFEISEGVEVIVYHHRSRTEDCVCGHYRNFWYPSRGERGPVITAGIPRPGVQPGPYHAYRRKREQGPDFEIADWREALVAIVGHEGWHHRQVRRRNGKGGFREVECDLAAYRAVGYLREDMGRAA
jgi:hypothetical protein